MWLSLWIVFLFTAIVNCRVQLRTDGADQGRKSPKKTKGLQSDRTTRDLDNGIQITRNELGTDYEDSMEARHEKRRRYCVPSPFCTKKNGYCVKKRKHCNGEVKRRECCGSSKKCFCCIPVEDQDWCSHIPIETCAAYKMQCPSRCHQKEDQLWCKHIPVGECSSYMAQCPNRCLKELSTMSPTSISASTTKNCPTRLSTSPTSRGAPSTKCLHPWKKIPGSDICYLFSRDVMAKNVNQPSARHYCQDKGGDLAHSDIDECSDILLTYVQQNNYDRIWVGSYKNGSTWMWYGGEILSANSNIWLPGNPSGDGDCVEINTIKYQAPYLNDRPCEYVWPFICEK